MRRGEIIPSLAAGLALLAVASASAHAAGYSEFLDSVEFRGVRAEVSYTSDSNVTRAPAGDALRDGILSARVSAGGAIPLSTRTRVSVQGFAGTQRFSTYTGFSNNFIGTQGDFFFRSSGEFGAPTYGAFARTAKEEYESTLRDGYCHAERVTVAVAQGRFVLFFRGAGESPVGGRAELARRAEEEVSLRSDEIVREAGISAEPLGPREPLDRHARARGQGNRTARADAHPQRLVAQSVAFWSAGHVVVRGVARLGAKAAKLDGVEKFGVPGGMRRSGCDGQQGKPRGDARDSPAAAHCRCPWGTRTEAYGRPGFRSASAPGRCG